MSDATRLRIGAPSAISEDAATPAATNLTINASTVGIGWVFQIPYADTITAIGYRQGVTTGTPAANSYTATLQSVTSGGLPGGDIGGGSPTATSFTPSSANDGKWVWITLANPFTATRGQKLCITISQASTDGTNFISIGYAMGDAGSFFNSVPYAIKESASVWSKAANSYEVLYGYQSSTRTYGRPVISMTANTTVVTGNRLAMKFTVPSGWFSTYTVLGIRSINRHPNSSYKFGLWNAAGTLLNSFVPTDNGSFADLAGSMDQYFTDTSLTTLSAGTPYYIGFECIGSNNVYLYTFDCTNAADLAAFPLGTGAVYSTWNGSAWTDVTTSRPWMELILDTIVAPSGGGGGGAVIGSGIIFPSRTA